jgi:molybdenum cofactor cytidylyltransferase
MACIRPPGGILTGILQGMRTANAPPKPPSHGIAAIVLAAGASTRLGTGRSKQLLQYQGRTLLRHSVEQALASSCRPVVVVLGAEAERCRRELEGLGGLEPREAPEARDVHVALNAEWAEGMGSSIRAGMNALVEVAPDARAVVITLCDQPLVTAAFIDRLVQRYLTEVASVAGQPSEVAPTVAAEYEGQAGVPALFPRARFSELLHLDGAAGARRLLRPAAGSGSAAASAPAASSRVVTLPCPEAAVDVDTITDYEALPQ